MKSPEAFYIERGPLRIFAQYYPGARDEGFVLCHPAPQDMMRAQYSQMLLARKIQSLGFPVLRFDYSGTGDSSGRIVSLKEWEADTLAAIRAFRKRSGLRKISLVGTRLGASLALLLSEKQGFRSLILWDPCIDGPQLLAEYREAHSMMLKRIPDEAPFAANQIYPDQSCGFDWPQDMQDEIARMSGATLTSHCKDLSILAFAPSAELNALCASWQEAGKSARIYRAPDSMHWGHDRYMKLQAFPVATLRLLGQIAEGTAHEV